MHHPAFVYAHPSLMGLIVLGGQKTGVVGGRHGQLQALRQDQRGPQASLLLRPPRAQRLQIEAVGKVVGQMPSGALRTLQVVVQKRLADLAVGSAGQRNQAVAVLDNPLHGRRLPVPGAGVDAGSQAQQVAVAVRTARQKGQPAPVLRPFRLMVQINAQNRLDALVQAGFVELDEAEEVALVRQGHGGHAEFGGAAHQVPNLGEALDDGEFAMHPQMNEAGRAH